VVRNGVTCNCSHCSTCSRRWWSQGVLHCFDTSALCWCAVCTSVFSKAMGESVRFLCNWLPLGNVCGYSMGARATCGPSTATFILHCFCTEWHLCPCFVWVDCVPFSLICCVQMSEAPQSRHPLRCGCLLAPTPWYYSSLSAINGKMKLQQ
jgi:hypothetical protein